jgi:hypothetical protein
MTCSLVEPLLEHAHRLLPRVDRKHQGLHLGFERLKVGSDFEWGPVPECLWEGGVRVHSHRIRQQQMSSQALSFG